MASLDVACACTYLLTSRRLTYTTKAQHLSENNKGPYSRISLHFSPPHPKSHSHTADAFACTQLLQRVGFQTAARHAQSPAVATAHSAAADDAGAQKCARPADITPLAHACALSFCHALQVAHLKRSHVAHHLPTSAAYGLLRQLVPWAVAAASVLSACGRGVTKAAADGEERSRRRGNTRRGGVASLPAKAIATARQVLRAT